MSTPLTLDLLRHGACSDGQIYRGRTDSALSEDGWRAMQQAVAELRGWDGILTSPAARCQAFSRWLATERGVALRVIEALWEYDFGEWDGRTLQSVWEESPQRVQAFWEDPARFPPPGGEALAAFSARLQACLEGLERDAPGQHLLLVAHGGVIRQLLAAWLGVTTAQAQRLRLDYAGLSRVRLYPQTGARPLPQIEFINRTIRIGGT